MNIKLHGSVNPLDKCLDVSFTYKMQLNTEKCRTTGEPWAGIESSNSQVSHLHTLTYFFYVTVLLCNKNLVRYRLGQYNE